MQDHHGGRLPDAPVVPHEDTPVGVGLAFPRGLQVDRVNVIPKKKKKKAVC